MEESKSTILFEEIERESIQFRETIENLDSTCSNHFAFISGKRMYMLHKEFSALSAANSKSKKQSDPPSCPDSLYHQVTELTNLLIVQSYFKINELSKKKDKFT